MAFIGSVGKFLGNVVKTVAPVVAPVASFATDLALKKVTGISALPSISSFLPGAGGPPSIFPGTGIFDSFQTSLGGPYGLPQQQAPMQAPPSPAVLTAGGQQVMITQGAFNAIVKLAQRLGIPLRSAQAVVRIGRNIIAKLLRFARANPGLTILNLLTSLGLTAIEATDLITWFSTHGKRRRRIRVTNVKALNRSVRRLEGFRRLAHRVEGALARRGVARSIRRSSRRCPRCRKNPCSC